MTMLLKLPVSKECVVLSGDKRLSDSAGITDDNVKPWECEKPLGTEGPSSAIPLRGTRNAHSTTR